MLTALKNSSKPPEKQTPNISPSKSFQFALMRCSSRAGSSVNISIINSGNQGKTKMGSPLDCCVLRGKNHEVNPRTGEVLLNLFIYGRFHLPWCGLEFMPCTALCRRVARAPKLTAASV